MWKKVLLGTLLLILTVATVAFFWIGPGFVIGILTYGQQAHDGPLQPGDPAPIVTVVDIDGNPRELSEWIGPKPVVLVFGSFT